MAARTRRMSRSYVSPPGCPFPRERALGTVLLLQLSLRHQLGALRAVRAAADMVLDRLVAALRLTALATPVCEAVGRASLTDLSSGPLE